jgi:DNA polymerase-3 subunit delta'
LGFAELIGHERVRELLVRAIAGRRLPPAVLFTGPAGVGKQTLALAAARALLCERASGDACEACTNCGRVNRAIAALPGLRERAAKADRPELFNHHLHPDLVLVEPCSTATRTERSRLEQIRIEQIRGVVRELGGRPFEGPHRSYVLDQAHLMTEEGANTLLKGLEEPPPGTHFLLVSAAPEALLPTIRSRCQVFRLGPLPIGLLARHLETKLALSSEEARLRASAAGGSLGAALAFESEAYRTLRDQLLASLEALQRPDALARMQVADQIAESGDAAFALTVLRVLLRDVAALHAGLAPGRAANAEAGQRLQALAQGRLGARAGELAQAVGLAREALRYNASAGLSLDRLMDVLAG